MDFAVAQLALIFLPGLIWASIDKKFGAGIRPSETVFVIRAFLFGVAAYAALFLIYAFIGWEFGIDGLGPNAESVNIFNLRWEIALSVPVSFFMAMLWLYSVKNRFLMKFIHVIGASNRYGDEDVWSFTFNSADAHVEYVHIRDIENGFIFAGWVNTYSENEESREILLRDAIVYSEDGNEVSSPPFVYLSRRKDNMWVEFPYRKEGYQDVKET